MSLRETYAQRLKEAGEYLARAWHARECSNDSTDLPDALQGSTRGSVWQVSLPCETGRIVCFVWLSPRYPDELPKIYVSPDARERLYPMPHLDCRGFLCVSDADRAYLVDREHTSGLELLLDKATSVLNDGAKGIIDSHYDDEFIAYWNDQPIYNRVLCAFDPSDQVQVLVSHSIPWPQSKRYGSDVVAPTRGALLPWLMAVTTPSEHPEFGTAFYLPIDRPPRPPFPIAYSNVPHLLGLAGEEARRAFCTAAGPQVGPILLLLGAPVGHERALVGLKLNLVKPAGDLFSLEHSVPFREASTEGAGSPVLRVTAERVDRRRLSIRGGAGFIRPLQDAKVTIVGCGSLGGTLAVQLTKTGVDNLTLVDPDDLQVANIARHICGFSAVGINKARAVGDLITSHFPGTNVRRLARNVLDVICDSDSVFDHEDLVVLATGNFAVERRICEHLRPRGVPVVCTWVEPLAVAGHVLYLHPSSGACFDCCFRNSEFVHAVVDNPNEQVRREGGCQTSFMPYSAVDVEALCSIAAKRIVELLVSPASTSGLTTWLNDTRKAQESGLSISPEYAADSSYSQLSLSLQKSDACPTCS